MENNRRSFFKGMAAFAAGVVGAKVASYVPKKKEEKEELLVTSTLTITHEGEQYHPIVVKKTSKDGMEEFPIYRSKVGDDPNTAYLIQPHNKPKIRKVNV